MEKFDFNMDLVCISLFCFFFLFISITKIDSAKATSLEDLKGTWNAEAIATGPYEPFWFRARIVVGDNGQFTGTGIENSGDSDPLSGTMAILPDGSINSFAGDADETNCNLDSHKTVMVCTQTWKKHAVGTTNLIIFTKEPTTYSLSDLTGVWHVNGLAAGPSNHWWMRGTMTVDADGLFSIPSIDNSHGTDPNDPHASEIGTLSFFPYSLIKVIQKGQVGAVGNMDFGKTVLIMTDTLEDAQNAAFLMTAVKKADSYSTSDLAGTWNGHTLASGSGAPWWERARITIDDNSEFTATTKESTGGAYTLDGAFTITKDGVMTGPDGIRCTMDSGKSIFVCTDTWSHFAPGTAELKIFVKESTGDDQEGGGIDIDTQTTQGRVTEIYVATFGRAPDPTGLAYWVGQVENGSLTLDQVAQSFFDQPETKAKYPEGTSNDSFISTIYQNVLNRDPDRAGLDYWVEELNRRAFSRSQAIIAIINGAKAASGDPTDAAILDNKTKVGLYFTVSTLGTMPDTALMLIYANNVMSDIDSSSQSLLAAKAYIDSLASQIPTPPVVTLSTNASSVNINQTITLTWNATGAASCTGTGNFPWVNPRLCRGTTTV